MKENTVSQMRGYPFSRVGSPAVLKLSDQLPVPQPQAGQVRIRVQRIGINYAEVLSRRGQYSWAPKKPYIPGMEVVGVIDAVGTGVDAARLGQQVIAGMQYGGYAEYCVVPAFLAFPAIEGFTADENAALLVNFMTAWVALFRQARVQAGETVLIQAAAGGVGSAAVKLLKAAGCKVVALAGSNSKLDLLKSMGADLALDYNQPDWHLQVEKAGLQPDLVLELVGGDIHRKSVALLKPFGRVAVAGYASIPLKMWNPLTWWPAWRDAPKFPVMPMAKRSLGMYATHIGYLIDQPEVIHDVTREMLDFIAKHQIRPLVGKVFDFTELPQAHAFMESRGSVGKIVLRVSE